MGTLGYGLLNALEQGPNTTPDEVTMQGQLGAMVDAGADACAIEVSSHGLDQNRLKYLPCLNSASILNIGADHLDYHGNIQNYTNAKFKRS